MRRSHEQTQELIEARVADFKAGDASESVLRASLKALDVDKDDVELIVFKAKQEKAR